MYEMHTHDIMKWQQCHRRFILSNDVLGLGYQPAADPVAITVGNLWHDMMHRFWAEQQHWALEEAAGDALDAAAEAQFPPGSGIPEYQLGYSEFKEAQNLFWAMVQGYQLWQQETAAEYFSDAHLNYNGDLAEYDWFIFKPDKRYRNGVSYALTGRLDLMAEHNMSGEWWIVEHKTTSDPASLIASLTMSWQPRIYTWAARKLWPDKKIAGVLYNIVTRTDPWQVKLLKTPKNRVGLPSRDKRELSNTTRSIYLQIIGDWCIENNVPEEVIKAEYEDQLLFFHQQEYPLYLRHPLRVGAQANLEVILTTLYNEIVRTTDKLGQDPVLYPPTLDGHPRYGHCGRCPFNAPCDLMDMGQNWQVIMETNFTKGEENETD